MMNVTNILFLAAELSGIRRPTGVGRGGSRQNTFEAVKKSILTFQYLYDGQLFHLSKVIELVYIS